MCVIVYANGNANANAAHKQFIKNVSFFQLEPSRNEKGERQQQQQKGTIKRKR